jgi:hypothetical protein
MQNKNGSKRLGRQRRRTRVMAEMMERRLLMSGNPPAVVTNGVLVVTGTSGADSIQVKSTQIGVPETADSEDTFTVMVNGVTQTISAAGLTAVSINSGDGNDTIAYSVDEFGLESPALNANIVLGNGNDTVDSEIADSGSFINGPGTAITAGNGNDYLLLQGGATGAITAGNGNDTLYANNGNDSLFATLTAGNGNDYFEDGGAGVGGTLNVTAMGGTGTDSFGTGDPDNPPLQGSVAGGESFSFDYHHSIITGRAFTDNFGTGVYQTGDTPLANAQVYVDTNNTGSYVSGDPTAATDSNGNYLITGLTPTDDGETSATNTYGVRVTPPSGYTDTPLYTQLILGQGVTNQNPSVQKIPAALTGTVIGTAGSYQNDGNTVAKAVDGNLSTFFDGPTANGNYVGLDLGSARTIASIGYAPRSGFASRMVGGIFQGSNSANFSAPATLYTITATPVTGVLTTVSTGTTTAYRYVRYLSPTGSYGNIAEVQFFTPAIAPTGSITVHIYQSNNGSSTNISGWGSYLDFNDDGKFDGNDVRLLSDTNGNITFSGLAPGLYYLEQNVPAGYAVGESTFVKQQLAVNAGVTMAVSLAETYVGFLKLSGTTIGTLGSYGNSGNTIANVFDGNLVSYFDAPGASGAWVGLALNNAAVVQQVQFSPRPSFESRMVGGLFQASNTANFSSGVVTLATITTNPTPGVLNTISLNNSTAYLYYRYIGPANSYCNIAELQFDANGAF